MQLAASLSLVSRTQVGDDSNHQGAESAAVLSCDQGDRLPDAPPTGTSNFYSFQVAAN